MIEHFYKRLAVILIWKNVKDTEGFERYNKVQSFPFADIYELKPEYVKNLQYEEIFSKQK